MTASKFTAERRAKALDCKAIGMSDETTAAFLGIDKSTFSRWLDRGRNEEVGLYADFYQQYLEASVQMNGRALAVIAENIKEPGIAKWFLERKEPGFAPPAPKIPAVASGPVLIQLAFGNGATTGEPVAGTVIDAQEVPTRPRSLPSRSA